MVKLFRFPINSSEPAQRMTGEINDWLDANNATATHISMEAAPTYGHLFVAVTYEVSTEQPA